MGVAVLGPRASKVRKLIEERGADDPLVLQNIEKVLRLARIDVTLLVLVVIEMAAKPGF